MAVTLLPVALSEVPWGELDSTPGRTIFQTREWLEFLAASQRSEPVVAQVIVDGAHAGWFTGAVTRRGGLRILGSPLPGWSTSYMGFTTGQAEPTPEMVDAVVRFAFGPLRCVHLELMDRRLELADGITLPRHSVVSQFHGFQLALRDDETLLAGMSQNARRNIRRSANRGIEVEVVGWRNSDGFAREYYGQVATAFAKRNVVPAYGVDRVQSLIDHLGPSGRLLMLRARTADGQCAATGLFPGLSGATAFFWMGASDPAHLDGRPNEAVMWHALRAWRERGATTFDFGGGGEYKAKYGGEPIEVDWLRVARFAGLDRVRSVVRSGTRARQVLGGFTRSVRRS